MSSGGSLMGSSSGVSSCTTPTQMADGRSSFIPSPDVMEDLAPMSRDRCNTWPMRRPNMDLNAQTSPLAQEGIPEEEVDLYDSSENLGRLGASSAVSPNLMHSPDGPTFSPGMSSPVMNGVPHSGASDTSDGGQNIKKSTTRKNAWGNMSYADLITQAIMESPEKRLTLSQVYEWMVQNVSYFRDKGDSNSSAGWKNSIRHNLSLHSRFMRIQNEGAGKSSWWVINPDAKPGRNPRRQRERSNTMDTASKTAISKSRRGARKKIQDIRLGLHSGMSSVTGSTASIMSRGVYDDDDSMQPGYDNGMFRPRTQSNISMPSARVSPSMEHTFEDLEFPPWIENSVPTIPSDIVDRTDQIRIDSARAMNGIKIEQKASPIMKFQTEPIVPQTYHELNSVRGPSQLQNPLLRNHPLKFGVPTFFRMPGIYPTYATTPAWSPTIHSSPGQLHMTNQSCASSVSALPLDLENLTLPDQPLIEMDMESLLRHELSQTIDHRINFD